MHKVWVQGLHPNPSGNCLSCLVLALQFVYQVFIAIPTHPHASPALEYHAVASSLSKNSSVMPLVCLKFPTTSPLAFRLNPGIKKCISFINRKIEQTKIFLKKLWTAICKIWLARVWSPLSGPWNHADSPGWRQRSLLALRELPASPSPRDLAPRPLVNKPPQPNLASPPLRSCRNLSYHYIYHTAWQRWDFLFLYWEASHWASHRFFSSVPPMPSTAPCTQQTFSI